MTRVLVVDDSALMRKVMRSYFEAEGMVVNTARSGEEALDLIVSDRPDVVTMDVNMPGMDGLTCLDLIMQRDPLPVVMVSAMTWAGARSTVQALELGAVDYVAKPDAAISLRLAEVRTEMLAKVTRAATMRARRSRGTGQRQSASRESVPRPRPSTAVGTIELVVVGASTGGPGVLVEIIRALPAWFPPVVIAQHLPAAFTHHLATRLDTVGEVSVREVTAATPLQSGTVYIGRGDADVVVSRRAGTLMVRALPASEEFRWHPSVERLTRSAAAVVSADRLVGVLLTGMGDDGASAMADLHHAGGLTIAESEESAVVWGMPGSLTRRDGATVVLDAGDVADQLIQWAQSCLVPAAAEPRKESHGTRT